MIAKRMNEPFISYTYGGWNKIFMLDHSISQ